MDAKVVANSLYHHFNRYDYILFNTYLFNWESDFFAVSSSGYKVEVEIKVSRGDFFRDFEKDKHRLFIDAHQKKAHHVYRTGNNKRGYVDIYAPTCGVNVKKMEDIHLPHQFYFACPQGLIKEEELPPYAGLLYVTEESTYPTLIRRAPYLHKRKLDLTPQLLHKFHTLWRYRTSREEQIETFKSSENENL